MTTPHSDQARWINNVAPRTTARNVAQKTAYMTAVRKEDRENLSVQH